MGSEPTRCVRCRSAHAALRVREAAYCAACYARVFDSKLRAGLELARGALLLEGVVRPHEAGAEPRAALAVAFSGGPASAVLLHAVAHYLAVGAASRVPGERPRLVALYVDDSAVRPGAAHEADAARALAARLAPYAAVVRVPLEAACARHVACTLHDGRATLAEDAADAADAVDAADARAALCDLFAGLQAGGARAGAAARSRTEDLHWILLERLLREHAALHGCAALLYGEHGARSAARLLERVAKGAGHKLPVEGAAAQRIEGLYVLHPMRPFLAHEVAFYAEQHGIVPVQGEELVPRRHDAQLDEHGAPLPYEATVNKGSIGRLTESLVDALQRSVSSTVSTIGGTGSKLVFAEAPGGTEGAGAAERGGGPGTAPRIGAKGESLVRAARAVPCFDGVRRCPLCGFPAQEGAAQWKAQRTVAPSEGAEPGDAQHAAAPRDASAATPGLDVTPLLCYACLQTLDPHAARGAQRTLPLPAFVLDAARAAQNAAPAPLAAAVEQLDLGSAPAEPHVPGGRDHSMTRMSRDAMRAAMQDYLVE